MDWKFCAVFIYLNQRTSIIISTGKMKNLTLILLAALLVSQTIAQVQLFDIVGPLTTTAFGCLATDGYLNAVVRAYSLDLDGSVDPNAVQTLTNAQSAGISTHIYMVICRSGDAVAQVDTMLSSISTSLYDTVWIKVEPSTVAGCQWSPSVPADNCAFITAAVNQFIANGITPGIFSTTNIWNSFFGSSCDTLPALGVPLWYANYDSTSQVISDPTLLDYVSFGGWDIPFIKQIGGDVHVTLCQTPGWHAFIDIDVVLV